MSQFPPQAFDQPRSLSIGLAIGALVCAILGLCVPGLGLVAIVLGIVALTQASSKPQTHGGKGMAIAAIIVGAVSLLFSILSIGILLPALGKARESARQLKSSTQLRGIDQALAMYASDNKGWLPEAGADWQARLASYSIDTAILTSPRSESATAADSYIYIPGFKLDQVSNPSRAIVAYENPAHVPRGMISVAYLDGHVEAVRVAELQRTLDAAEKPGRATPPSPRNGAAPRNKP